MKKVLLKIDGMTCSACSSGLEKYLNKQDGIKTAVVNLVMNNANIEYLMRFLPIFAFYYFNIPVDTTVDIKVAHQRHNILRKGIAYFNQ